MPEDSTSAIVEMRGIGKVFRAGAMANHVLTDIHLDIRPGEFVSIAGPSGCGKTTLLSLMGLLDMPSYGELRVAGQSVTEIGRKERAILRNRHIGFVFQSFNLIDDLTVADNVALPLTFRDGLRRSERTDRVVDALASVGMAHRANHYPTQLSGGQQQRVAVARALVGDPAILLADEPTGNLDLRNGEIVMALLSRLHGSGRTICMVTHDERFGFVADRLIRLLDGQVVDESTYMHLKHESECGLDGRSTMEPLP